MLASLIMCRGLPASGKSTWSKEQVKTGEGKVKRVNKDELREMIDAGKFSREREKSIVDVRNLLVAGWLNNGHTVIVDDTNFAPEHERVLRHMAEERGVNFQIKDFTHVPLGTCLARNRNRTDKPPLPDEVIFKMWKQYLKKDTPFDKDLPDAFICDLDGTLADLNGRSPFDSETVDKDLVNYHVHDLVVHYMSKGLLPIFFSGRKEEAREKTTAWLKNLLGEEMFQLRMRENNDQRADEIVKKELYKRYVDGKYNVRIVIDDRPKVIRMWRFELNLPTIDVGWGIEF